MSEPALYLRAAAALRRNNGQWSAYNAASHCVVLAGPGSGKTKTLTIKMARVLAEEVEAPRGVACITYNNECARELATRLDALGVQRRNRVFIGTVHSFALTQIILPYVRTAEIDVPPGFRVATQAAQRAALEVAYDSVIDRGEDPHRHWRFTMDRYRRSHLDREAEGWREDPETASLIEAYESELRRHGLIDFDDMPILAVRAMRGHPWVQRAILAKYPVLFVDEYQDLGSALHRMVMGLCFTTGVRLFAVGDVDQSIYGFTGANPTLLQRLAARPDVEVVRLRLNYRSGAAIVTASEYALGEERGYEVPEGAPEGMVYFHPRPGDFSLHADHLFAQILPEAFERTGVRQGGVGVLYQAAWIGDFVAASARNHGYEIIRADTNALYPRGSPLMRWLESCATWCCGGWRRGKPRFGTLSVDGQRLFAEAIGTPDQRLGFQRLLLGVVWNRRQPAQPLAGWLSGIQTELLDWHFERCRSLDEERALLVAFIRRTQAGGDADGMTLAQFAGFGEGGDRISLSTLHSAKGREFEIVVLFGMDNGRVPRTGAGPAERSESRRSFYVGFTRAKKELHIVYSQGNPSPFVREVQQQLDDSREH
ncbi:MAG TPA: ATP-dependent helicase [Vicinamibacterales bacterium]